MKPEVFREILKSDPEVLLRSDVATAEEADRAVLIQALLEKCEAEQSFLHHDWGVFARFKKLTHASLAEQLRPYICDSAKSQLARSVAIDIAEACRLQALENELVQLALDSSQPLRIRKDAANAVVRIGTNEAQAKLKPLAFGKAGDDPDDELKGYGLQAVWPAHLTAEELFSLITFPKRENHIGTYQMFLFNDLVPYLSPADLPLALKWAEDHDPRQTKYHPFEKLIDAIMLRAWGCLETLGVREAFARVALLRINHYENILGEPSEVEVKEAFNNIERRRKVVEAILPLMERTKKDVFLLCYSLPPLVLNTDIFWMIEQLRAVTSEELKHPWAQLIERIVNWQDPEQINAVLTACQEESVLAEVCARDFEPVLLDSTQAREMKEWYLQEQRWQEERDSPPLLKPSPTERIAALLAKCESGDLSAWWRLNWAMTLKPDKRSHGDEYEPDLTVLPGWQEADATTRGKIVETAKKYVLEQQQSTTEWLGKGTLYRPAFAGYRALQLLLREEPSWLSSLSADVWKKWAPILLAYSVSGGGEKKESQKKLLKKAYPYAPTEILNTLMILIDKSNKEGNWLFVIERVRDCWDEQLAKILLVKVKDATLKPTIMGCLLIELLDHNIHEAKAFAESLIFSQRLCDESWRPKRLSEKVKLEPNASASSES